MAKELIERMQRAISEIHGVASTHLETVPVKEVFEGKTRWEGDVEVFQLIGHPQAFQCFVWTYTEDPGMLRYIAVLRMPPLDSPQKAIQAFILSQQET